MTIFQISKILNFDSSLKLWNFENLLIFEIVKFEELAYFRNCKFVKFFNLEINEIYEIVLIN